MNYNNISLIKIAKSFQKVKEKVEIGEQNLQIDQVLSVALNKAPLSFVNNKKITDRINLCHQKMMEQVKKGVPIYGCNSGFGERACVVVNRGAEKERVENAVKISEGITHIDVSVGPVFEKEVVRAAMMIRINMLLAGVSAVKKSDLDIFKTMINKDIIPVVNQYGGIGASGDLAHNCRVLNAARGLEGVRVINENEKNEDAAHALKRMGINKLKLDPKAGLGLVNGDNFSTALALLLANSTLETFLLSLVSSAMTIESLLGTNRSFHPLLSDVRPHDGQIEVASIMRHLLNNSKLAYQEMQGHKLRPEGIKIQDGYSMRCLSQYHGVNAEKIKLSLNTITKNMNSVSDNPLWVTPEHAVDGEEPWQWVSGGNFIASHMVEVIDGLRKTLTQITKLNDRHLFRLVSPTQNNGLSANLSDTEAITQCAFKGMQIQSGMFDVYSSLLSIPVSTFFGIHEEGNQDITTHALTSGILGIENLRITRYSLAQNLIAVCQAVDLRGGVNKLSPKTQPVYNFIREKVKYVTKERPLNNEIEAIYDTIVSREIIKVILENVF